MKLLDRYIFRELLGPFALGLFIFTIVLLLNQLVLLAELVINKGLSVFTIGKMVVYIIPSFLSLTIPMAVLLATLVAFGRLSADNEITAFMNQGFNLFRLGAPVVVFGVLGTILTLEVMLVALPWGNYSFKRLLFDVAARKASIGIEEGVFTTNFSNMVIYVSSVDHRTQLLKGIIIQQPGPKGEEVTLFAKNGRLVSDPDTLMVRLALDDVLIQTRSATDGALSISRAPRYLQRIDVEEETGEAGAAAKGEREMTVTELAVEAARRKASGTEYRSLDVEIHKKFAIPFACLVFSVLGVPLGLVARRSDRLVGFGISMAVIFLYYILITAGETLGDKGALPPIVAMWWGNVILGILGAIIFYRKAKDLPIRIFERIGDLAWRIGSRLRRRR